MNNVSDQMIKKGGGTSIYINKDIQYKHKITYHLKNPL